MISPSIIRLSDDFWSPRRQSDEVRKWAFSSVSHWCAAVRHDGARNIFRGISAPALKRVSTRLFCSIHAWLHALCAWWMAYAHGQATPLFHYDGSTMMWRENSSALADEMPMEDLPPTSGDEDLSRYWQSPTASFPPRQRAAAGNWPEGYDKLASGMLDRPMLLRLYGSMHARGLGISWGNNWKCDDIRRSSNADDIFRRVLGKRWVSFGNPVVSHFTTGSDSTLVICRVRCRHWRYFHDCNL